MPNTKGAIQTERYQERRRLFNLRVRRHYRAMVKAFKDNPTKETLSSAYSALDTASKKGVIHSNTANRLKAKLAQALTN